MNRGTDRQQDVTSGGKAGRADNRLAFATAENEGEQEERVHATDSEHDFIGAGTVELCYRLAKPLVALRRAISKRRFGKPGQAQELGQRYIRPDALGEIVARCRTNQRND